MTQTAILQGKMRACNFTLESLAKELKMSKTSLFNKVHNKKEFLCSEVQAIGTLLCLTDDELKAIFFAKDVE